MRSPPAALPAARARVIGFFTLPSSLNTALRNCCWRSTRPRSPRGVGHLLAVDDLHVVAGAHERRAPARRPAPPRRPRRTSRPEFRSNAGCGKSIVMPPERVDQLGEADEVDLEVVVDRDAERLLHGLDQPARAAVVGGVDLLRAAGLGDRHVEVAWDRHHLGLAVHEAEHAASCRTAGRRRRRTRPGRARRRRGLRRRASRSRRSGSWCRCRRRSGRRRAGSSRSCRTPTWRRGSRPGAARRSSSGMASAMIRRIRRRLERRGALLRRRGTRTRRRRLARRRGGCALLRTRAGRRVEHGGAGPWLRGHRGHRPRGGTARGHVLVGGRDVDLALVAPGGSVDHGRKRLLPWGPRSMSSRVMEEAGQGQPSGASCRDAEFMQ